MYVDMIQTAWKTESIYGAVRLSFIFNMPIPKSYSEKKRQSLIGKYHTKRPDTSNMIKFTEDCLTGIAFADDSQVVELKATKRYAIKGSVEIKIEEI